MGFDFGLSSPGTKFKRKYRWVFNIPGISEDPISALPPSKAARPSISFKEIEAQHLSETVYFPGKPDWKPITITLYDIVRDNATKHPVFEWLRKYYDPEKGSVLFACEEQIIGKPITLTGSGFKKPEATLQLLGGCGEIIETWKFINVWPQNIEFGDLDMQSSEVLTCDLTLRYDRAYIEYANNDENLRGDISGRNIPTGIPLPRLNFDYSSS
jgi:hypothetical protein